MCWARSSARTTCSVKNLEPIVILAGREEWQEGKQSETAATRTKRERRISGDSQAALEEAEQEVREDGEKSGGDGASEDEGIADERDTAKDECAEAAGVDGGGDRGDADGDDGGSANAGENNGQGEREADAEEDLRAGHAHGFRGFDDGRVDAGEADIGIAQDGEKRVEDQSDDGGALADAADEGNGNEEAEEGEAGNSLEDAGDAERDSAQSGAVDDEHAEGDANENRNGHGDDDESEMVERGGEDFGAVLGEEGPIAHLGAHAGTPGATISEAVKARTSGWSRRRNSCGEALATMRPPSNSTMREGGSKASRKSCVTKTIVLPRRRASALNSRWSSARVTGSSAPKGSSIRRIGGSAARARATPTRCRWPPESSRERRRANSRGSRPTSWSISSTRAAVRAGSHFSKVGTRATFSATVKWGKRPAS